MSKKDDAIRAIEVAIGVFEAALAKRNEVIADKNFRGDNVDKERAERARLDRKLGDLRDLQADLRARQAVSYRPRALKRSAKSRH